MFTILDRGKTRDAAPRRVINEAPGFRSQERGVGEGEPTFNRRTCVIRRARETRTKHTSGD